MAKLTDSKRTVEIRMMVWNGNGYDPDWSDDFFDVGLLPRIEDETDGLVYMVQDVEYCIEQAQEWANEDENNAVIVTE